MIVGHLVTTLSSGRFDVPAGGNAAVLAGVAGAKAGATLPTTVWPLLSTDTCWNVTFGSTLARQRFNASTWVENVRARLLRARSALS